MVLAVLVQNPIELLVLSTATNTVAATPFLIVAMLISKYKSMAGKPATANSPQHLAGRPPL